MLAFCCFRSSELCSHCAFSQLEKVFRSCVTQSKVPEPCISFGSRSWISRCDSSFADSWESTCVEGHVELLWWNILNDLLAMDLFHFAQDCPVFPLEEVVISFVVPEVSTCYEPRRTLRRATEHLLIEE